MGTALSQLRGVAIELEEVHHPYSVLENRQVAMALLKGQHEDLYKINLFNFNFGYSWNLALALQ
jgi:hypothetical protein